jgi:ATP-dependent helicase/nuclease subunit A
MKMKQMKSPADIANHQQKEASNPQVSTFVAASAGSGKTKLLTDRILRLLLSGTPAQKILCLTYTKAAAAEMAIRLNTRLGAWVVMGDEQLKAQLSNLDVQATDQNLDIARRLFAEILDLPGGMRISTIHAFCQSLLRRFPIEAQLSPHFEIEDETDITRRLRDAREFALSDTGKADSIFSLASETNELDFAKAINQFLQDGQVQYLLREYSLPSVQAMQAAALNVADISDDVLQSGSVQNSNFAELKKSILRIAELGTPTGQKWASRCLDWLALPPDIQHEFFDEWLNLHFTDGGSRRAINRLIGKNLTNEYDNLVLEIDAERLRLENVIETHKAKRLADFNKSVLDLISPMTQLYQSTKLERSLLSYADLVSITVELLSKPDQVAWILYKLDEGIDHLLLDEVQDTSQAQWRITEAIADEFFNGLAARDIVRTIFAVGDQKQSIFSFQGADVNSFDDARRKFRQKVMQAGEAWLPGDLSVSFRSTEQVLSIVDAVFADGVACQGVCAPGTLKHFVSRQGQAGVVTLWPMAKSLDASPAPDWGVPENYVAEKSEKAILASGIADHILRCINDKISLPSRQRTVTPGDFLILVRHRDKLVAEITRACKARDIPIAGVDRLILNESQAVSDLLALCDSLLLPSDDMAFAQFLVSPLGGLTDESLMELAINRKGSLSAALFARRLERNDWAQANDLFQTLRREVDFISPFSLLALTLGRLGGRARLLHRLGGDAAEAIDELLAEAQSYAKSHPASLQQFVYDLRQSGAAVKFEPDSVGDVVRIMTVHGAKGLQAPIVILPDTTSTPKMSDNFFWIKAPGQTQAVPILCPHKDLRSAVITKAIAEGKQAQSEEYHRLLYVALTRAEDELIICGAEGKLKARDDCWYNLVKAGFLRLPVKTGADGVMSYGSPQRAEPDRVGMKHTDARAPLPKWAGAAPSWDAIPPAIEAKRPEPLAPSRSAEDEKAESSASSPLLGISSGGKAMALTKGKVIHTLLQHLPDLPVSERLAATNHYLGQPGFGFSQAMKLEIARSVSAILDGDGNQALFGLNSRAEVPLAGIVGDAEIGGLVDRLVVEESGVTVADFKTDRQPPADISMVPAPYLRQIAAYSAILRQIFPEKPIFCQLIWTETGTCMPIPSDIIARYAPLPNQPSFA